MSPPLQDQKLLKTTHNCAQLGTMVDFSFINKISFHGSRARRFIFTGSSLLLLILCRVASSAALSHTGGFRVGGGVHDSYTFQCGLVGSFISPGIDTR